MFPLALGSKLILILYSGMAFSPPFTKADDAQTSSGSILMDASEITWAHAVNSRGALEQELAGNVTFLEADISMGSVIGSLPGPPIPIMAHPPDVTSDISLDQWLDVVIGRHRGQGIKLDFKYIEAVAPSLNLLFKHKEKINFPLWLNADILPGPVNSTTLPVQATEFLRLRNEYFPTATLSLGWTTYWFASFPPDTWHYGWEHVRSMVDALSCSGLEPEHATNVTFPVRGVFACRSIPQLQWLLEIYPKATLTVWSGKYDALDVQDLLQLRGAFEETRMYYDTPEPVNTMFRARKTNYKKNEPKSPTFFNRNWMEVNDRGQGNLSCTSLTYVTDKTVSFGKGVTSAVLLKDSFQVSGKQTFEAQGFVTFFPSDASDFNIAPTGNHQLVLVLADVSLFSKNATPKSSVTGAVTNEDTDVIWTAMNSSRLHIFEHDFSSSSSPCHFFKLDTSASKPFQAWTVPCESVLDGNTEEALALGTNEIPSGRRLILPPGPVMFGLISSGSGYAIVHELDVKGEATVRSEAMQTKCFLVGHLLMVALASLFFFLLIL